VQALEALADPTRRRIVELLAERDRDAGEIASHFPVSRPAVSRHLRVLREHGLVRPKASRSAVCTPSIRSRSRRSTRGLRNTVRTGPTGWTRSTSSFGALGDRERTPDADADVRSAARGE